MVAHDLHFIFLPTEEAFLNQHLVDGRNLQAAVHDLLKFFPIVGDPATRTAEGKTGANNQRHRTDIIGSLAGLLERMHRFGLSHIETNLEHALFEELAILPFFDRIRLCANHFNLIFIENTGLM